MSGGIGSATNRRMLLGLLVLLGTRFGRDAAARSSDDPVAFVTALYRRALAADDPNRPAGAVETEAEFLAHFTATTRALWIESRKFSPTLEGPILSVWFGHTALPGTVTLGGIRLRSRSDDAATVEVVVFVRGERRAIDVALTASGSSWLVANVAYPDDDFVSYLKRTIGGPR